MSDETNSNERVGFCQDCGKPLTKDMARTVGQGVFCEPCLTTRLNVNQSAAGSAANVSGYTAPNAAPGYSGEPHPWVAAFLGFIPGVGAMYNGQFAKGIAHIVVFAVLVSLSEHVHGLFGLFVTAWLFYMAFDAYHTAQARRDGLPLPDIFGFNNIGEKMGFGKGWGSVSQARPQAPVTPPPPAAAPSAPAATPNWGGYVPPPTASAGYAASTGTAPYTAPPAPIPPYSTLYSAPQTPYVPMPDVPVPAPGASFPLVAIWLIGLGVLFALGEWMPRWHVNGPSIVAIVLGAAAASWFVRRLGYMGGMSYQGPMLHMMRGPVILAVLAVLFLLQGVHAATLAQTWPVILLALGAVMLGERLGVGTQPYHPYTQDAGQTSVVPPASTATTSTATQDSVQRDNERDGYTR